MHETYDYAPVIIYTYMYEHYKRGFHRVHALTNSLLFLRLLLLGKQGRDGLGDGGSCR